MSKKLAAKASMIQLPPAAPASSVPSAAPAAGEPRADAPEQRMKTAPGSMAHFMASQSSAVREAEELRERLKAFDGAQPVRLLDPKSVRASRWANRHADSFADAAFDELKAEIASAGGNVQPASVRRIAGVLNGSTPGGSASDPGWLYELVYGHRRHRACLELGLPLQAMVVEATDRELFEAMERENRSRKNLSAWEQGSMYKRALDEGLYPSQRKLAEALGVDVSLVSKSLSLTRLPEAVVAAFASPLDFQFRWAQPLSEALQRDPDAVLARALSLKADNGNLPAARVFAVLVGAGGMARAGQVLNRSTPRRRTVQGSEGRQAHLTRDAQGRVVIEFPAGVLGEDAEAKLAVFLEKLLAR